MTLHIAIIAIGVLVFVVPAVISRIRRPAGDRELDVDRQRMAGQRRRLAAERGLLAAELAAGSAHRPGCPWRGFPMPPRA